MPSEILTRTGQDAVPLNGKASSRTADMMTQADPTKTDPRHGTSFFFGADNASSIYSAAEALTGPVAGPLLEHVGILGPDGLVTLPSGNAPVKMIDLACGTGIVLATLQPALQNSSADAQQRLHFVSSDLSDSQVSWVRRRITDSGWRNCEAAVLDASKLALPSDSFDYITCAMALDLMPHPVDVIKEALRVCKPGATFAFSNWKYEGWVPETRDAIAKLDAGLGWPQDSEELICTWSRGLWHRPGFVERTLVGAGFEDVRVESVTKHVLIDNADQFLHIWRAFIVGVTHHYWTEKQRRECMHMIEGAFKRHFDAKYGEDKPFTIERTVVIASGRKPLAA